MNSTFLKEGQNSIHKLFILPQSMDMGKYSSIQLIEHVIGNRYSLEDKSRESLESLFNCLEP